MEIEYEAATEEVLTRVSQGSILGPFPFLIYIDDLSTCIQLSKTYHFADDTSTMQSNKSLEVLAKQLSKDLSNLSYWFRENKLGLNVQKIDLIFFLNKVKLRTSIKFNLQGKRPIPTQSVKYLGVLLDEYLQWTKQLSHVNSMYIKQTEIQLQSRHLENNLSQSLWFTSAICMSALGLSSLNKIQILKKCCNSANPIYKESNILKFKDLIYFQNCLFMLQIENDKELAASFLGLKYCGENHNYKARSMTKKLLNISQNRADKYGKQSAKYSCIIE